MVLMRCLGVKKLYEKGNSNNNFPNLTFLGFIHSLREKRSIAKAENPNSVAIKGTAIVSKPGGTSTTHHRTPSGETKLYVKKHKRNKKGHI